MNPECWHQCCGACDWEACACRCHLLADVDDDVLADLDDREPFEDDEEEE